MLELSALIHKVNLSLSFTSDTEAESPTSLIKEMEQSTLNREAAPNQSTVLN